MLLIFSTGFEKIVEILIGKGANINAKNKLGASALILAASKGIAKHILNNFDIRKKQQKDQLNFAYTSHLRVIFRLSTNC